MKRFVAFCIFVPGAMSGQFALAQPDTLDPNVEEVIITTDRVLEFTDKRVSEQEGAQTIGADYIRAQQATTLADALRKTTSVQVDEEGGNQGSIVIIRGLKGDQVSVRVDGAPKNFNQVRHGGADTIFAEPDMFKTVTVIPGVASNIYGNGSMGGVIRMETKDPSDLMRNGQDWGGSVRLGYETNGDASYLNLENGFSATEDLSVLFNVVKRSSSSYEDGAGIETLGGATGSDDLNLLGKVNYRIGTDHLFEVSHMSMEKEYTARGAQSRGTVVSSTDQNTELNEDTTAFQYGYTPDSSLINMNVRFSKLTTERYRIASDEETGSTWGTETDYIEIENTSMMSLGAGFVHALRVGADYTRDDIQTAYADSADQPILRERQVTGVYLSDSITLSYSLDVVLSARYDRFETVDHATGQHTSNSGVSPKIHVNWAPFTDGLEQGLSFYGLVGQGFRAPSVHESFGRGSNDGVICSEGRRGFSCSERVPNPNLDSEYTDSKELGIRFRTDGLLSDYDQFWLQIGYIDNDVQDFIDSVSLPDGSTEYEGDTYTVERSTYTNVDEAVIDGWEYSLNYSSNSWFAALSAQTMDGYDKATGMNLRDVSPHSVNATLGMYLFDGKTRAGIDMTQRDSREVDGDDRFNRLGYTIYDVFASYQLNDNFGIQLRVENALDKLYTKRYQSLSVDPDTGEQQDLTYYQPGRNIKLTFEYRL